jgi:hypothetical protein
MASSRTPAIKKYRLFIPSTLPLVAAKQKREETLESHGRPAAFMETLLFLHSFLIPATVVSN